MNTQVQPAQNFQERMFARIKENMGDLMTDEELKKLLERAVEDAFFKPREELDRWGARSGTKPPLFVETVQTLMKDRVDAQVKAWLDEHPDEVHKLIKDTLDQGIVRILMDWFESKTSWPMQQLAQNVEAALNNRNN